MKRKPRNSTLADRLKDALTRAQERYVVLVEDPETHDEVVQDVLAERGVINIDIHSDFGTDEGSAYSYCIGSAPDVRIGKDWQVFRVMRGGEVRVFDAPESVISKLASPRGAYQ